MIVGEPLDTRFLQENAGYLQSRGANLMDPRVRADVLKKAHSTKLYKDLFDAHLREIFEAGANAQHPRYQEAHELVSKAIQEAGTRLIQRQSQRMAGEAGMALPAEGAGDGLSPADFMA
jgi:aspartate aminotransferase-like enzyme